MAVFGFVMSACPKRRKMRATLQASQNQECYRPESYNNDGAKGKSVEHGSTIQNTEDTAKKEQSTDLNATQGRDWEKVKCNVQLWKVSAERKPITSAWKDTFDVIAAVSFTSRRSVGVGYPMTFLLTPEQEGWV